MTPRTGLLVLLGLWLAALLVAPLVGSHGWSLGSLVAGDSATSTIVWQLRLPRVLLGLLAGGALAVCGLAFQTVLRNPLAEPYTLGVASGAALGAVLAMRLELAAELGFPAIAAAAFLGALLVAAFILALAGSPLGSESSTLLLAGVALSLTCSALILFIQYLADFTQTYRMVRWMMGGLAVVGYQEVLWVAPWAVLGSLYLLTRRWELNLLLTGEELAVSRGLELVRFRFGLLAVTSAMVAALVAVTGPVGFVGLIVPHILRRASGHDHLYLVPACFLGGGAFLVLCDLAARTLLAPAELPVGVLTALLGGPFFLWLLIAGRRQ